VRERVRACRCENVNVNGSVSEKDTEPAQTAQSACSQSTQDRQRHSDVAAATNAACGPQRQTVKPSPLGHRGLRSSKTRGALSPAAAHVRCGLSLVG